jgi:hypothetical protein
VTLGAGGTGQSHEIHPLRVGYDTDGMRAFPTKDASEPMIYVDQQARVFVERLEEGRAVIHWASAAEVKQLANRHRIEELTRLIGASG